METIRLFDEDSKLTQFEACVLSCEEDGDLYKVTLTQSAFFPEEGGQSCDKGTLQDLEVVKVLEKDRIVYHWVKEPLWEGDTVEGFIDWDKRFNDMQQHSGEHIVSGLMHTYFGFDNVGFHLGKDYVTMDFNGTITREQLRMIEKKANEAVAKNIKIDISFPSKDELEEIDYRSKKELEGPIRIVTIPGYDICACCAPHVYATGEIGMIKLVSMENYKGGIRIYMHCGFRALADYNEKLESVQNISKLLSVKPVDVYEAVSKQKEELAQLRFKIGALEMEMLEMKINALPDSEDACIFDESLSKAAIKKAMQIMNDRFEGVSGLFKGNDTDGYSVVIGSKNRDCKAIGNLMMKELNGRGGGSKELFQGSVKAKKEEISKFFHL